LIAQASDRSAALSDEQRAAVQWGDGPLMVLAGAGTGKTTVVVERVRHLLTSDGGLLPENVLVLTYNVRAAEELRARLEESLGIEVADRLWVHTFHSLGHRILTEHRTEAGLGDATDVLDPVGQRLLLRELRPRFAGFVYYSVALDSPWTYDRFADLIARAKDEQVTPEEYAAFARARREAFDFTHGSDAYDSALESIRSRTAGRQMQGVRDTRAALRSGPDEAGRIAMREARREVTGGGYATAWTELTVEQQRMAVGLKHTFLRDAEAFEVLRLTEEAEAYAGYQAELRRRGLVDFGEQQLRTIELLMERPNLCRRYQAQFRHVLVDEFQDANMAQILLLELIGRGADKPDNVVVVGDDDQSIYRFRGASYAAFEQFRTRFERPPAWEDRPAGRVASVSLLTNRRSSGRILAAAQRLIGNNAGRLKRDALVPLRSPGHPVEVIVAADEADEADAVVGRVRELFTDLPERITLPDGSERARHWSDIAVLYRKHRHRDLIVDRLRKQDIPYVVVGGTGLFAHPEVRDVEAALRVMANPQESVPFVRLLAAAPWRLDAAEILRVTRAAEWDGRPVFQAAATILHEGRIRAADPVALLASDVTGSSGTPEPTLWTEADLGQPLTDTRVARNREQRTQWREEQLDARLRIKLERILGVLDGLIPRAHRDGPFALLEDYLERTNVLHDLIATGTPAAQRSVLALARMMRFVADWQRSHPRESLADFVAYLSMYQEVGGDLNADTGGRVEIDGVQLMTVYQAKGLEYEIVVVPRLVEGQFPDLREDLQTIPVELLKQQPPAEFSIAEERRLSFVAMTRARRHLVLTGIESADGKARVSRFLDEVAPPDRSDPIGIAVERRVAGPGADVEAGGLGSQELAAQVTSNLLRLMPVPAAQERRFALRRRAVELIGALEALDPDDHVGRTSLTADLVAVAEEAAGIAEEARRSGLDPVTLAVLSSHSPAGRVLLELAPLPPTLSHSQLRTYGECPLRYAFERVYRIPVADTKGFLEFGSTIHVAFEVYARARLDAVASGLPPPGYEALKAAFDSAWKPRAYEDAQAARHYQERAEPALRKFYEREMTSLAQAVALEASFAVDIGEGIRFTGTIDRIDRHPDGTIEIIDYKTGRRRSQRDVDADAQLTAYAMAVAMGAVRDAASGEPLPAASRLSLYFTESDQAITTTRSREQIDEFRDAVLATAARIRSGDFAATPGPRTCQWCDYRALCPSRWGDQVVA
jgi:DNA helicase-2/ATP-dependent DNA helicase PcrA